MFVVVVLLLKMISCNCNMVIQNYDLNAGVWDRDPKEARRDWNLILQNIQAIKEDCGEVCDLSVKIKFTQGSIFDQVKKHIKCDSLFSSKHIDAQDDDIIFANAPRK